MNSKVMDLMLCFINHLKMAVCSWLQSGCHGLFFVILSVSVYKSKILNNPIQERAAVVLVRDYFHGKLMTLTFHNICSHNI